jgi:exodeoxyribonuclease-3
MAKELKLISWNVNGIRAVVRKGFFKYLAAQQPDILCLQETKAQPDQLGEDILKPEGYTTYWNYPREKKGYSGVAILTREKPEDVKDAIGREEFDMEGRILAATYPQFMLFSVYFPKGDTAPARRHRLDYKLSFYDAFLEYIDAFKSKGKNIIICGDFNTAHEAIDLARPKENEKTSGFLPEERAWIDRLIDHGYTDTFRMFDKEAGNYTWWDMKTRAKERNVGWRLDYFFVSSGLKDRVTGAFILDNVKSVIGDNGSDHCPVGITLKIP